MAWLPNSALTRNNSLATSCSACSHDTSIKGSTPRKWLLLPGPDSNQLFLIMGALILEESLIASTMPDPMGDTSLSFSKPCMALTTPFSVSTRYVPQ